MYLTESLSRQWAKVSPSHPSRRGLILTYPPAVCACASGNATKVEELLREKGTLVQMEFNKDGVTALMLASNKGHMGVKGHQSTGSLLLIVWCVCVCAGVWDTLEEQGRSQCEGQEVRMDGFVTCYTLQVSQSLYVVGMFWWWSLPTIICRSCVHNFSHWLLLGDMRWSSCYATMEQMWMWRITVGLHPTMWPES